jgi:hypothetical protein
VNDAGKFLKLATSMVGVREGSGREAKWAAAAGISATTAWCSAFISYFLQKVGVHPPSNPAYSGAWLDWSEGRKLPGGYSEVKPGDLLIFDWGDGGITDHVAAYIGGGRMVQGNDHNNKVSIASVPTGNIVGVVRPKKFEGGGTDYGGGPVGFAKEFVLGDPLEALDIGSGDDLKKKILGVGESVIPTAEDIVSALVKMLGVNAAAILLNVALVGGGGFLVYYGISKAAGVSAPVGRAFSAAAGGPGGIAAAAAKGGSA